MGAIIGLRPLKPLIVPYRVFPDAFGGDTWSAILNVQIALPSSSSPRTKRFEALIDSGASRCLFHSDFATHLGIDYRSCPIEVTQGIGGSENTYLHEIALHIPGGPVVILAGFKDNLPIAGLLGMKGFFEHFKITFDGPGQCCALERVH